MNKLLDMWIAFVNRMNKYGIPVPTVRDPKTGKGSITAALVVFSAGMFGFCILFMLATVISKWAGIFIMTEASFAQIKTAADYSFQFLLAAIGGYIGRYMQKGGVSEELSPEPVSPKEKKEAAQKADDPDQP